MQDDRDNNAYFIMTQGANASTIYDGPGLLKRNLSGFRAAAEQFRSVEIGVGNAIGVVFNNADFFFDYGADNSQHIWRMPTYPGGNDADEFSWGVANRTPVGSFRHDNLGREIPGTWTQTTGAVDTGPVTDNPSCFHAILNFTITVKSGAKITFIALVNTVARFGIIIGITGNIIGGDPVAQIVETAEDIAKVVIGAFSDNVVMIAAAVADAIQTWWDYNEALQQAVKQGGAIGKLVTGSGKALPANSTIPGKHVIQTPEGKQVPVPVVHTNRAGNITYRTVGEVVKANKQSTTVGGLAALGIVGFILFVVF